MFQRFFDEGLAHASYLIACPRVREAVIIDPRRDVDVYVEAARAMDLRIVYSFETHIHADFVCGSRELLASAPERSPVRDPTFDTRITRCRTANGFASATCRSSSYTRRGTRRSTSPSSPVSRTNLCASSAATRCLSAPSDVPDLLGEEQTRKLAGQLYDSLFTKLLTLDDRIEVHPGHGAGSLCGAGIGNEPHTTIGQERRFNKMLQHADSDVVRRCSPGRSARYAAVLSANEEGQSGGAAAPGSRQSLPWARGHESAQALRRRSSRCALLIDLRGASAFAERHPLGALNLAYGTKVGYWAGWVLPADVTRRAARCR